MTDIVYKEESFKIIGACMKVHTGLGSGFLEAVYQEALEREFAKSNIQFKRQVKLSLVYDGIKLKKYYIADFVCFNSIVVEIKATSFIHDNMLKQTKNYLKATNSRLGLLVNFGEKSLSYKRILNRTT
jgi:GxxExxY protein